MFRLYVALVLALATLTGCTKQGSPEQVADAFVEAYFRHADQQKALEYTAFGASQMLEKELADVAPLRKDGYTPAEAAGSEVSVHRGAPTRRDERIRVPYEIVVRTEGGETVRDADIELASIKGAWKVVRVGLKPR